VAAVDKRTTNAATDDVADFAENRKLVHCFISSQKAHSPTFFY
jgi:hypothetical protein